MAEVRAPLGKRRETGFSKKQDSASKITKALAKKEGRMPAEVEAGQD
jgi:hypothetical protein